jgi:hypothetical protein
MAGLTETRGFWIAMAIILFPLLFAELLLFAIMPPLNMIFVPIWFFVCAGAIGSITNGLERAKRRQVQREARRYAPGVIPVQRTNAL